MNSKIMYTAKTEVGFSAWIEEQVEGTFEDLQSEFNFVEYIDTHPQIWEGFQDFTFEAIRSGVTKLSSKMIINRLRWHSQIEKQDGEKFKIDDQCHSFLSRFFVARHPQHKSKFEFRSRRKSKKS